MRFLFIIIFISLTIKSSAQVISSYKTLMNAKCDTIIRMQYFKKADSALLSKIDSFNLYLAERKYDVDTNFFYQVKFDYSENKLRPVIRYVSHYVDYLMITNSSLKPSNVVVFAFTFYNNRLVLFTTHKKNITMTAETAGLLKNLIYENVNEKEKGFILHTPNEILVQTKPVKGYYLE